jgi:hypothetical protein
VHADLRRAAESIGAPGGFQAVQLRVAETYITQFSNLAKQGTARIVPSTLSGISGMLSSAMSVIRSTGGPLSSAAPESENPA